MSNEQLSLFGPVASPPSAPRACPPVRAKGARPRGESPQVANDVLTEVRDGRYGLLDDTDIVMVFTEPDRVRKAIDDAVVHRLMSAGLVRTGTSRDTTTCLHGAVRRPVTPLRLTKRGREQLARWSALRPFTVRR
jgi:hypothetical protein